MEVAEVPDGQVCAHAFANTSVNASPVQFAIRRGGVFVNEYARLSSDGKHSNGGTDDPNHLLGAFPVLFPYGEGGFEVGRVQAVSYETHARWALQYSDRHFRKDLHFVFQVFGVLQKRAVCRAACLQIKRATFTRHQAAIQSLTPTDLMNASREEARKMRFSNPAVQHLRQHLTAVRSKVMGTDESRHNICSQIWGLTVAFNPPSLWITINPSDTNDPIAQVMTGQSIDLDSFVKTAGPEGSDRAIAIASDPYAAAKFFHFIIRKILSCLFGIEPSAKQNQICQKKGVLGTVAAYVGAVEAQGRGTLHLHLVLWLVGAPTADAMKEALRSDAFRDKVVRYISRVIRADLDGGDATAITKIPKERAVSYSRPCDPRQANYGQRRDAAEKILARSVQVHACTRNSCLVPVKGRMQCKRRAPFALSPTDWIQEDGSWGPKRTFGYLNNWNPVLLQVIRANHNIKLITNGAETKDIAWYITNYATKKQQRSGNASALLATRLAFHQSQEKTNSNLAELNRRLIQRCANTLSREQEFSAPEVISYIMGWGDRYISHSFTSIYTDPLFYALRRQYPQLRLKR